MNAQTSLPVTAAIARGAVIKESMLRVVGTIMMISATAFALNNGLALTPPMGWNPYNAFGGAADAATILQMAHIMVSSGLRDAGYRYVALDCGWSTGRDANGILRPSTGDYPNGLKPIADSLHALGLRFSMYCDIGSDACCGVDGSYPAYQANANQWASWGFDYVKVDYCGGLGGIPAPDRYAQMRDALKACGRPIVYSICEWGSNQPWLWGDTVGNLWRIGGDINASWGSITGLVDQNAGLYPYARPGSWNDPDMLEVGRGMTVNEDRAHFSLWCIMAAPLLMGNDLRSMSAATLSILTNAEVIAVDQDSLGFQGRRVVDSGDLEVWAKRMRDSSRVVLLLNRGTSAATISFTWANIWLSSNETCTGRNLWTHQDIGPCTGSYSANIPSHDVVMLRLFRGPDQTPPLVTSAYATPTTVAITFSEPVEQATAQNAANYSIDNKISISAAVLQPDLCTVNLTTSALTKGTTYTLTVNNVRDRAATPNTIAPNTKATFQVYEGITKIRYYPRTGWSSRMVGGVFEGTNGDPANGPYTTLYTITAAPPENTWTEVASSSFAGLQAFRCIRYRGPAESYCNVSEIEYYIGSSKMQGTVFGSPGSYNNSGNDYAKAFDGDVGTFMDYSSGSGGYSGMCMASPTTIHDAWKRLDNKVRISVRTGTISRIELAGFPSNTSARIELYDMRGTIVRSIPHAPIQGSRCIIDGIDNTGRPLTTGVYVVRVTTDEGHMARPLRL
jgi:alpha-galactosidase